MQDVATLLENLIVFGLAFTALLGVTGTVAGKLGLSNVAAFCATVGADVGKIVAYLTQFRPRPPSGPSAAAVVTGLVLCVGCAGLLGDIPPGTSVCVTVSAWGLSVEACGSKDEPVTAIRERAVARLLAEHRRQMTQGAGGVSGMGGAGAGPRTGAYWAWVTPGWDASGWQLSGLAGAPAIGGSAGAGGEGGAGGGG